MKTNQERRLRSNESYREKSKQVLFPRSQMNKIFTDKDNDLLSQRLLKSQEGWGYIRGIDYEWQTMDLKLYKEGVEDMIDNQRC